MQEFRIILKPDAIKDLDKLRKYDATMIVDHIERHLHFEPARESRARIKRLRGVQPADYRLRVEPYTVFYRIVEEEVHVLRGMHKDQTSRFYEEESQ